MAGGRPLAGRIGMRRELRRDLGGRPERGVIERVQVFPHGAGRASGIDRARVPVFLGRGVLFVGVRLDQARIDGEAFTADHAFPDASRDNVLCSECEPPRFLRRRFSWFQAAMSRPDAVSWKALSASAGGICPIGPRRRRWLNQSTHLRVSHSTASAVLQDGRRWMTPALNRPMIVSASARRSCRRPIRRTALCPRRQAVRCNAAPGIASHGPNGRPAPHHCPVCARAGLVRGRRGRTRPVETVTPASRRCGRRKCR